MSGADPSTIVGTVHAGSDRKRATALTAVVGSALLWVGLAASAPGDPKRKLTAEGQALAKRFVLRKADLPLSARWKVEPTDFSQPNPACLVKHYSYSALTLVGDWRKSGAKMLVIGLGAAGVGFLIGNLFHAAGG